MGQGEKEGKHELNKSGDAGKALARSVILTGARVLSMWTGGWLKRKEFLRLCPLALYEDV